MKDDYLWDGSGPPDPDIERLERLLAPLRATARLPPLPELASTAATADVETLDAPLFSGAADLDHANGTAGLPGPSTWSIADTETPDAPLVSPGAELRHANGIAHTSAFDGADGSAHTAAFDRADGSAQPAAFDRADGSAQPIAFDRAAGTAHNPTASPAPTSTARPARRRLLVGGLALAGVAGGIALRVRMGRAPGARAPADLPVAGGAPGGWGLTVVTGRPRIEGQEGLPARLAVGETLETDDGARARLDVPGVGTVQIDPRTRVTLLGTEARAHRLRLSRGVLHGTIFAPPGTFFIETPAGTAVDLGCVYTVEVGRDGDGVVTVQAGWVGFQQGGRESFIPQGASCAIRVRTGPGTPCFLDATPSFQGALTAFDTSGAGRDQARALRTLLAEARPRDALTLWHLLERALPDSRPGVLRRLQALVPAAAEVPAARVLAGDRGAVEALWDRLDLGPISVWRHWKADLDRDPAR